MLHLLPAEVTLNVLSHLPISSLLSLPVLSRRWFDFFATNQSRIFHRAAILHEYINPEILLLEHALSLNTSRPWAGSTSWKDFCCRSFQLRKNWEGKGRVVARELLPTYSNPRHIQTDENAGICITTSAWGIVVSHLFSGTSLWSLPEWLLRFDANCEYDNGYLVFDNKDRNKEVWRLSSDFAAEDEVAADSPPDDKQMAESARAAQVYEFHAPRGHFRPWALLRLPEFADVYRLVYPTLICANSEHAFLHDVRTGSLVQMINIDLRTICDIDMDERHVFVCEQDTVHVISLESGKEVLRIPAEAAVRCSQRVEDPLLVSGDWFVTPLSVSPNVDESPRPKFIAARVSRDGHDLVVLSARNRVVFIRDFERICRGETTFERAGVVLGISPEDTCRYLDLDHGRVCVATTQGLYVFTFGPGLLAKAVFVRPSEKTPDHSCLMNCMQLTDRRIYFTWGNARRRRDIPMFRDEENDRELPPSRVTPQVDLQSMMWGARHGAFEVSNSLGCIDFSLMPEA